MPLPATESTSPDVGADSEGLAASPYDAPMVLRDTSIEESYALKLQKP
jgi:hypothetical protein